jgi:competence ComEA-like helix-hairpin-helix protein
MIRMLRSIWKTLLLAGFLVPAPAQDDLPAGKGTEILENTCTECHGLDKVLSQLRTERQWREIAVRMRSKGATMSDDELKTLVEYLAQNFGAVEKDRRININQASAKEMENALELRPRDCAAIVRYREKNGPFTEWRDLRKVSGIDKSKLEAVKDRIAFRNID